MKEPSNWEDFFNCNTVISGFTRNQRKIFTSLFAGLIKEGRSVEDCEKGNANNRYGDLFAELS